jgi:hypothetical protein
MSGGAGNPTRASAESLWPAEARWLILPFSTLADRPDRPRARPRRASLVGTGQVGGFRQLAERRGRQSALVAPAGGAGVRLRFEMFSSRRGQLAQEPGRRGRYRAGRGAEPALVRRRGAGTRGPAGGADGDRSRRAGDGGRDRRAGRRGPTRAVAREVGARGQREQARAGRCARGVGSAPGRGGRRRHALRRRGDGRSRAPGAVHLATAHAGGRLEVRPLYLLDRSRSCSTASTAAALSPPCCRKRGRGDIPSPIRGPTCRGATWRASS